MSWPIEFILIVFSYDARISSEWSSVSYNTSGRLLADLNRQPTVLTVTNLRGDDQALYHCRVDYLLAPTRNVGVNLTVIGEVLSRVGTYPALKWQPDGPGLKYHTTCRHVDIQSKIPNRTRDLPLTSKCAADCAREVVIITKYVTSRSALVVCNEIDLHG